ncbi:SpoIIAA family protein [Salinisphaera aquimarina]|uniref:STAS/SEC14 domain-containing protein n=1 Tax=Salinisphaera aquimarina TaxID=2094031 RepID=A0ABV7ER25_9GAMM
MLKTIEFTADADHVVALELDGEVAATDFENVLAAVEEKLSRHDKLRIYVEIKSIGSVSPQALFEDIKTAVKHWNRFEKEAVVTDIDAISSAVSMAGRFIPGIEIKAFGFNQRESAHQWVIA